MNLSHISEYLRLELGWEHIYAFQMKLGLSLFLDLYISMIKNYNCLL